MVADHLVGRAEEVRQLERLLDECAGGRTRVVGLFGEAGIGKTRLLGELVARAELRGHLVLVGSASELERDLPFSVFVNALDEYLEGLDPVHPEALGDEVRVELAHVFPSLSALGGHGRSTGLHERYRSHRAVRALLESLAETRPVVLVLDDFHWADSASVELFGALLRRPPIAPVLMAVGLRPRHMTERFVAELERAHRAETLIRIELGALTPGEACELLGQGVDRADASLLYEESGGNPFYLEQLARSLDGARRAVTVSSPISLSDIGVPFSVAASLGEELAILSEAGRLVLEGAAVAGDPFEPEYAAAAAEISEPAALDGIDELLHFDLVRATDVPRRFRFRHPLVRRAVYETTSGAWRLSAHERCAKELAARGATAVARAHHVERSARVGDLSAVAVLREAGEAAMRLAPESAARWFGDALRLMPHTAPAEARLELLLARARALNAVGHFAEGHNLLLEGLAFAPKDQALSTGLIKACAGVELLLGRQEQAYDRLATAFEELADPVSPEGGALMIDLALSAAYRGKFQAMRDWAQRAAGAARTFADPALTAAALAIVTYADAATGAIGQVEVEHSEASAMVDSLSDEELASCLNAAVWLAAAELCLDRFAEADEHAGRALRIGQATGQGEVFVVLHQVLGRVWVVSGRLAEATDLLDGAVEAARLLGNTQALVWNLSNRALVALTAGDVELALVTARESVDLSHDLDEGFVAAWAAARLAEVLMESGQQERAVESLLTCAGGEELTLIPGSWRAYFLELLTRGWIALDRLDEAERACARAEAWASVVQLELASAWAHRAAAAVSLHKGDPAHAADMALEAAAAADNVGAPIEAALSRTLAGRAFARTGQKDRAVAELQRAAAELDACGAIRYRNHAEQELRKLGHRIHRRTRPGKSEGNGLDSLTERELQVAHLVVDRRTNPEIAAELFISQKTVETHLRNIFHKVNVSSRVELAHAVERSDRMAPPGRDSANFRETHSPF